MAACFFQNPAGHKFSLPSCICGYNDFSNIFSEKLSLYYGKLPACLADDYQLHLLGEHGARSPFPIFHTFCHILPGQPGLQDVQVPRLLHSFAFENTTIFWFAPRTRAMSLATDGFSAITSDFMYTLLIIFVFDDVCLSKQ